MKKCVEIIQRKTVEIDIPDEILSERSIQLFSEHMWPIDDVDDIFEYTARQIMNDMDGYCLDFIGLLGEKGITYNGNEPDVTYKEIDSYNEVEIE